MRTVQIQVRLLLKKQSDQGLHFDIPVSILRNIYEKQNLRQKVLNKMFEILGHLL